MKISGVNSPVITIMDDSGKICVATMEQHIAHLAVSGLNGLFILGSLGEFYLFSMGRKKFLVDLAIRVAGGKTQIIVGVGSMSLADTLELAHYAQAAGADAINVLSPYYFAPSEKSMVDYFGRIAMEINLPIQLYNFPAKVGADIMPRVVKTLTEKYSNIVSIKDTVDNISHTRTVIRAVKSVRQDFTVLSGFDEYYLVNRTYEADDFATTMDCAKKILSSCKFTA